MKRKLQGSDAEEIDLTIAIIVYNRCDELTGTINAIKNALKYLDPHYSVELLLVEDPYLNIYCSDLIKIDLSDWTLIKNENKVTYQIARNIVLQNAHGKYLLFVDSDIELDKESIRILLNFAEKNRFGVIGPQSYNPMTGEKSYSGMIRSKLIGLNIPKYSDEEFFEVDDVQNVFMFDRTLATSLGINFDPRFIHEIALFDLKFKMAGYRNFIINRAVCYDKHGNNSHFSRDTFSFAWYARAHVWKISHNLIPLLLSAISVSMLDFYYFAHYYKPKSIFESLNLLITSYLNCIFGVIADK
jgi:glycosyltransferase involved in cell wall biosynthesis